MLVDSEIRERLGHYCMVTKQTQEKAANQALREVLERAEQDPVMEGEVGPRQDAQGRVGSAVTAQTKARKEGKKERMKQLLAKLLTKRPQPMVDFTK